MISWNAKILKLYREKLEYFRIIFSSNTFKSYINLYYTIELTSCMSARHSYIQYTSDTQYIHQSQNHSLKLSAFYSTGVQISIQGWKNKKVKCTWESYYRQKSIKYIFHHYFKPFYYYIRTICLLVRKLLFVKEV